MSQALLAIQNILQNSNIFYRSRETVLFTPFSGGKKVTHFSGFLPTSVSYPCSDQILADLVNQGGCCCSSHQDVPKILKIKKIPLLENC